MDGKRHSGRALRLIPAGAACLMMLSGCFDYDERIVFKRDLSGHVDIKYDVPVYDKHDKSIISFLPIREENIRERFGKNLRNLKVNIEKAEDQTARFKRRGSVGFRVYFRRPAQLKGVLLGDLKVNREGERLRMDRSFPTAKAENVRAGWAARQIRASVQQTLQRRFLNFYISFPPEFLMVSNRGVLVREGMRYYRMGLTETMEGNKPILWNLELIAAPQPVIAP